jgi:hypothetical protein
MAITTADRNVVNEGSPAQVKVTTYTLAGEAQAPTTLHYRIDDVATGQAVKALAEVATPAAETVISIAPEHNLIINPSLLEEARRLTVLVDKDTANQAQAQLTYYVKNISYA